MSSPATHELRDLLGSYRFFAEMQRLSSRAGEGDPEAVATLDSMLNECASDPDWRVKTRWCSAAVRALVSASTEQAMKRVIEYVRSLPDDTPYGMVELLGGLLPGFGQPVLGNLEELAEGASAPARAAGMQALCNFSLEGHLPPEYLERLLARIKTFEPDHYLTHQMFELVQPGSLARDTDDLSALFEDVIVDGSDGPDER